MPRCWKTRRRSACAGVRNSSAASASMAAISSPCSTSTVFLKRATAQRPPGDQHQVQRRRRTPPDRLFEERGEMRATIKLKLGVTFLVVILLSAISAAFALSGLGSLRDSVDELVDGAAQEVALSQDSAINLLALVRAEKNMIMANSPSQVQEYDGQIQKLRQEGVAIHEKLAAVAEGEAKTKLADFQTSWQQWLPVQDKIRQLMAGIDGRAAAEEISEGEGRNLVKEAEADLHEIVTISQGFMAQAKTDAESDYEDERLMLLSAVIASLLIATIAGVWISMAISRGLGQAVALANAVAVGDLDQTIAVKSNDEIKDVVDALNRM